MGINEPETDGNKERGITLVSGKEIIESGDGNDESIGRWEDEKDEVKVNDEERPETTAGDAVDNKEGWEVRTQVDCVLVFNLAAEPYSRILEPEALSIILSVSWCEEMDRKQVEGGKIIWKLCEVEAISWKSNGVEDIGWTGGKIEEIGWKLGCVDSISRNMGEGEYIIWKDGDVEDIGWFKSGVL